MKRNIVHLTKSGFTLVEIMIVVAVIGILMGIGMFPYMEYMKREALSASVDTVAQEWILAHKVVRNGIVFSGAETSGEETHARMLIKFEKNATSVKEYLVASGVTLLTIPTSLDTSPDVKLYKEYNFDR